MGELFEWIDLDEVQAAASAARRQARHVARLALLAWLRCGTQSEQFNHLAGMHSVRQRTEKLGGEKRMD